MKVFLSGLGPDGVRHWWTAEASLCLKHHGLLKRKDGPGAVCPECAVIRPFLKEEVAAGTGLPEGGVHLNPEPLLKWKFRALLMRLCRKLGLNPGCFGFFPRPKRRKE